MTELQGNPIVHAVDRVEVWALEERAQLLPGRDKVDVDRLDIAAVDEAEVRVPRG
jgi:hypothetical protein